MKKHSSDRRVLLYVIVRFGLWWRSKALTVIDRNVDAQTLIMLDKDIPGIKLMMPRRVHQLQLMVLVFLFVLSCMSLSDYWVLSRAMAV